MTSPSKLKVLDLFAGIGGFAVACKWAGVETAQFVELNPYSQKVLRDHCFHIPIHDDVRTFHGDRRSFDIITAGIPCTGTSNAGLKTGLKHPLSSLFRDTLRIIENVRPKFTVIENPTGLIDRGLRAICGGLRMVGYSSELAIISAAGLGASHRRQRLFVVSYPHSGSGNPTIKDISRTSEMRSLVSQARNYAHWLQVKPRSDGSNNGLSCSISFGDRQLSISPEKILVEAGQCKGRLTARILMGRTVTPQQALIPLLRIKQLMAASNHA